MRLRAIRCALWFGVRPYWMYEDTPHYAPMSYRRHLTMNLAYAWSWLTFRETAEDRAFEVEVNGRREGIPMFKKLWRAALDKLSAAADKLQAAWPKDRVLKTLQPAIAAASGGITAWVADHFPGLPPIESGFLAGIFAIGVGGAYHAVNKIIDTWQAGELREHEAEEAARQRASEERIAALTVTKPAGAVEEAQKAAAQKVVADVEAVPPSVAVDAASQALGAAVVDKLEGQLTGKPPLEHHQV